MSPTNIHSASALLSRAGTNFEDQATILPFGIPVYTIFQGFSQLKLDKYSEILNDFQQDIWLRANVDPAQTLTSPITSKGHTLANPPERLDVPKACISGALSRELTTATFMNGKRVQPEEPKEPLHFVLIIQGKDGGAKWKIVSEDSFQGVARAIMFEVLNRYSVIFSGAIFESDLNRLKAHDAFYTFVGVQSPAALNALATAKKEHTIGVIC